MKVSDDSDLDDNNNDEDIPLIRQTASEQWRGHQREEW